MMRGKFTQKFFQALNVDFPVGWQLEKDWPGLLPQPVHLVDKILNIRLFHLELFEMGEKAVGFYSKNKSLGNSPIPFFECLRLRYPIKGIIDLHGCEIPQVMPQLIACWDPLR